MQINLGRTREPGQLAAGPAKLPGGVGNFKLSDGLAVTLPAGYGVSQQPGPDFIVHHVHKLLPFGQPTAYLGIYVGGHPGLGYKQQEQPPAEIRKIPGKLLGQTIDWYSWSHREEPSLTTIETIAPLGLSTEQGLAVHLFLSAKDPAHLTELRKVAESLNLVPRP